MIIKRVERLIFIGIWLVYIFLQSKSIYGGDAGDLATASYVFGIPHPPGYPFYTLLGGIIIRLIPFSTIAWRVGLVSSFFGAFSVYIFFLILTHLTRERLLSFIGSILLAFLYPFWLYSEVTEIFSLSVFIILMLLWAGIKYKESNNFKFIYLILLLFGLTIVHHHIIIFIIPDLLVLLWKQKNKIIRKITIPRAITGGVFFILGLLPLVYLPIASSRFPVIDWEHPTTLHAFLNLLFRTTYGTFVSGPFSNPTPNGRFYSYLSFYKLFLLDLKYVGLLLLLLGVIASYRKRILFWPLLTGFVSFSFFLYYASFSLVNDFSVATYERFTLFLYLFCIIYITLGIGYFRDLIIKFTNPFKNKTKIGIYKSVVLSIFIIYPLGLFFRNLPKIKAIRDDFTAEKFAQDILDSAVPNSLIFEVRDTVTFNLQYVYYANHYKNGTNILPISAYNLFRPYYVKSLKRSHPQIIIPKPKSGDAYTYITEVMKANSSNFSIYTNFAFPQITGQLVPNGLLMHYVPDKELVNLTAVMDWNDKLWNSYQNISANDVKFQNLFLSDIPGSYSVSHQNYANYLTENKKYQEAIKHLKIAQLLTPEDPDIILLLGQVYAGTGSCTEAEDQFKLYIRFNPYNEVVYDKLIDLSRNCFKDKNKAEKYSEELKNMQNLLKVKAENL